ncbi:MAG: hydrogenase maturation protease [Candidatus Altiarchaeota archaeon]|nr:hydrogenase maturation protease [Candidatus Altiarchaeota archaeon]
MKTLILGIGNPILTDDGVGVLIAERLRDVVSDPEIDVREESTSGLDIISLVRGYDRLILVDAIKTGKARVGEILRLSPQDITKEPALHFSTLHDADLMTSLNLGSELGIDIPSEIVIYAVEVENVEEFGEKCTPEVEKAIPKAVELIKEELGL